MRRQKTVSKVLELKGFAKEQLEVEVRRTRDELNSEVTALEHLEGRLEHTITEFNSRQNNSLINTNEVGLFYDYLLYLNRQIGRQREVVQRKLLELEEKQKAMLEAYKEKRLLEILHDKALRGEMRKILLSEQKEMDFDSISRRVRR